MIEAAVALALVVGSAALTLAAKRRAEVRGAIRAARRLGEGQGAIVAEGYLRDGFKYDVVWRREVDGRPTHVFIVRRGGALEAMASLKHAYDLWRAEGFYITSRRGVGEVQRLLSGTFHEARGHIHCLTFEELRQLAELRERYGEVLDALSVKAERRGCSPWHGGSTQAYVELCAPTQSYK